MGIDRITKREQLQLDRYLRYQRCVAERKRLIGLYSRHAGDRERSAAIFAWIEACRPEAYGYLNAILTEQIATSSKAKKGRKKEEVFAQQDLEGLQPFH